MIYFVAENYITIPSFPEFHPGKISVDTNAPINPVTHPLSPLLLRFKYFMSRSVEYSSKQEVGRVPELV